MSIKEIIRNRVSNSKFTNTKVDVEHIMELLDYAVYAPNHKMREPWRFIILEGLGKINFINNYLREVKDEQKEDIKKITRTKKYYLIVLFILFWRA